MMNIKHLNTGSQRASICVICVGPSWCDFICLDVWWVLPFSISRGMDGYCCMDMESATFLPRVMSTVYNRNIPLDRLFVMHSRFLDLIIELNNRDPVLPSNSYKKIRLRLLTDLQIDWPKDHELWLFVVVFGYALNTQFRKAPSRRSQLVLTPFCDFAIDTFYVFRGSLATVPNRCPYQIHFCKWRSEQLWTVKTVCSMLMSQVRVFVDGNMKFDVDMGG